MTAAFCRRAALVALASLLAACATPQRPPPAQPLAGVQVYSGRLALQVEGEATQSFSAGFELRGAPQAGELTLTSPLAGTLAAIAWTPQGATLRTARDARQFATLDALVAELTGTALPVAALFDWLRGVATPVPGWEPDVSQVAEGRLRARRIEPAPRADLRIVFGD